MVKVAAVVCQMLKSQLGCVGVNVAAGVCWGECSFWVKVTAGVCGGESHCRGVWG